MKPLWVEPLTAPGGNSLIIEVGGDLAAIQTVILKLQDAIDQGLMGRVKQAQGQCPGLDRNPKNEAVFGSPLKFLKGKSEITQP